jgi:hypothetical protein
MFDDYTHAQLVELRLICIAMAEQGSSTEQRADALLLLEYIDQELAIRERRKAVA